MSPESLTFEKQFILAYIIKQRVDNVTETFALQNQEETGPSLLKGLRETDSRCWPFHRRYLSASPGQIILTALPPLIFG